MRKKSHISVAKGVITGLDMHARFPHRLSLYIGSIWPDCIPSFITKRHTIEETFEIFEKRMEKFIRKFNAKKDMGIMSTWRMGVVLHYIADYFTFPHNAHYTGGFKEHCVYEEALKKRMYRFVDGIKPFSYSDSVHVLPSKKHISDFILERHEQYRLQKGNVDLDCKYAVLACMSVMASLLAIVSPKDAQAVVAA